MLSENSTGKLGEKAAADFLKQRGYHIIEMNYKNKIGRTVGEIDIVAKESKTGQLVFVEVKARKYERYKDTLPEENITPGKLRKLSRVASAYLSDRGPKDSDYRFDAVSVWIDCLGNMAKIKHIKGL